MAKLTRIRGITPKPQCKPVPWLPCDWKIVFDIHGAGRIYADFWRRRFFTDQRGEALTSRALEALAGDYFYETEPEPADLPAFRVKYAYAAVFSNDNLARACVTLMQLNIAARLVVVVTDRGKKCSFVIATSQPAVHVLRQYFRHVEQIDTRTYDRVLGGSHHKPRELRRFTFPDIAGVGKPVPLPVSPPSFAGGSVMLGQYLNQYTRAPADAAGIPFELLNRHVFVCGTNGSGKTNTVMKLVHEVHNRASVLVFDIKREYRSLAKTLNADVYGFNGGTLFTHNLLKPECAPERWVKEFAHIFAQVISKHMPATGTGDVVAEELDRLYQERGVYDGSTDYPHIGDLLDALEKRNSSGSRERNWLASGLRVLRSLRIGATREAFFVREGVSLKRLLDGAVVVELDGIGDPMATNLLVSVLLQKIRHSVEGEHQDVAKHLVVVEEAQHVLAKGNEATSVLTDTAREIRAFGVGLVYVTQVPSDFSKDALANANTLPVHKLVHPEDKRFAANLLGLPEEAKDLIERLPVGQAFARANNLMLIQVDKVERPKVWDHELSVTVPNRQDVATNPAHRRSVEDKVVRLPALAKDALLAIGRAEAVTPSSLRALLHRSQSSLNGALTRLLNAGLVAYVTANAGPGRPPAIYFLTPEGLEAVRQETGAYPDRQGSSHDHKAIIDQVTASLGLTRLPHDRFDILYEKEGRQGAIEVETGSNNDGQLDGNLTKMLDLQGEAQFVAADDRAYNRILQTCARWTYTRRP